MSSPQHFNFAVIGCGGIGSAACYWLSRANRGSVLGLEQFELGHHRGESQDHSRIIRLAYDHMHYTRLTPHTYSAWSVVEDESGSKLVHKTGGLVLGPKDSKYITTHAVAMRDAAIPFDHLNGTEAMKRWPQWRLDPTDQVLYQADSGFVDARKANATHICLARSRGATIIDNCKVTSIERRPSGGVVIQTAKGVFTADKIVITSGAWTNALLAPLNVTLPLIITKEQVNYYNTSKLRDFQPDKFPVWIWVAGKTPPVYDCHYGIPCYGEVATKAGEHEGGIEYPLASADVRPNKPDEDSRNRVEEFLRRRLPDSMDLGLLYTKPCHYTLTPDRDFIVDILPNAPEVAVAIGAGHAYKWCCLLGMILTQLTIDGSTPHDIHAFRVTRPSLGLGLPDRAAPLPARL